MYARGGIFSITSRILVVDLLSSTGNVHSSMVLNTDVFVGLLNPETVTGLIVLHAEKYAWRIQ